MKILTAIIITLYSSSINYAQAGQTEPPPTIHIDKRPSSFVTTSIVLPVNGAPSTDGWTIDNSGSDDARQSGNEISFFCGVQATCEFYGELMPEFVRPTINSSFPVMNCGTTGISTAYSVKTDVSQTTATAKGWTFGGTLSGSLSSNAVAGNPAGQFGPTLSIGWSSITTTTNSWTSTQSQEVRVDVPAKSAAQVLIKANIAKYKGILYVTKDDSSKAAIAGEANFRIDDENTAVTWVSTNVPFDGSNEFAKSCPVQLL